MGKQWVKQQKAPLIADNLSGKHYLESVLEMNDEDRNILMLSEAERIKTFQNNRWLSTHVSIRQCARTGFYFAGGFIDSNDRS